MTPNNRRLVEGVIESIDQFVDGGQNILNTQSRLQSAIPLFDNEPGSPAETIRIAEADLEEIQFARLLDEQRPAAVFRLDELRGALMAMIEADA